MENRQMDTPETESTVTSEVQDGSMTAATDALLKMLDADDAPPATEEEATEEVEEESQPETEEESTEAEEGEDESEEEEYEPEDNRDEEGKDDDVYAVRVDGQDIEVSLSELVSGYSRQSDYTKKTQELAAERKQIEEAISEHREQIEATNAIREQYVQATGQFIAAAHGDLEQFARLDWRALKEEDPIEYVTKRDEYREAQARIQHAQRLQQQAAVESDEQRAALMQQHVVQEHALMAEKVPEWGDTEKRTALAGQLRGYAESIGYGQEEINGLADHRSLQVLLKAMQYDALQNGDIKKKKIRNKPKLVKSGTSRTKDAESKKRRKAQINRLKETGTVRDAASLLEDLI